MNLQTARKTEHPEHHLQWWPKFSLGEVDGSAREENGVPKLDFTLLLNLESSYLLIEMTLDSYETLLSFQYHYCSWSPHILYFLATLEEINFDMNLMFVIVDPRLVYLVGMTKTDAAVQTLSEINPDVVLESFTLNITTVQGFETFIASLTKKSFREEKEGTGVDLVLSCVDNYEARMVVNQACNELNQTWMESGFNLYLSRCVAVSGHIQLMIPGETACFACAPPLVVASGVDERVTEFVLHLCLLWANIINYLTGGRGWAFSPEHTQVLAEIRASLIILVVEGYNALKDYFPTMAMKPNPQCSNGPCLERQKEYMLIKPARDAAAKAKMEEELSTIEIPIHDDNEWNIR
ncbi:hypothetical protein L1987_69673 [Smallanthus sonchifolius]|uniref:Uncharacterized protein n=1 Tax=Smallanthus sonchifolius TaxID=185202 RepID=A0ACB9B7B3_9ASTR|nr:hypothetical protein L1987_69673 [Smallanthus sonchifolius]